MRNVWDYTSEGAAEEDGVDRYFLGLTFNTPLTVFSKIVPEIILNVDSNVPPETVVGVLNDMDYFNMRLDRFKIGTDNGALRYVDMQVTRKGESILGIIGGDEKKTSIFSTVFQSPCGQTMYNHRIYDTTDVELIKDLSERLGWSRFAKDITEQIDMNEECRYGEIMLAMVDQKASHTNVFNV